MILYSVLPPMPEPETQNICIRWIGGVPAEGENTPQGFKVRRLLTTDPHRYLLPEYAPGAVYAQPAEGADGRI